ncbi:hypothetical protein JCM33374_g985 [Metschnikowia sp. JCM 33374]|nr:hypothetical protein JCM33374_g985 [Metschnikowia sp. JCM 33374]
MPISDSALGPARHLSLDTGSRAISWSKNGFICYASPASQGHNLNMTFLENTNGKNWQLAAPHTLTIKPSENSPVPDLQMVSWSTVSTDLAVFDHLGNFYILLAGVGLLRGKNPPGEGAVNGGKTPSNNANGTSTPNSAASGPGAKNGDAGDAEGPSYELTSYNHAEMIYRDIIHPETYPSPSSKCVAFEWLGLEKPSIINKPAKATENPHVYSYGVHSFQSPLLAHPITTKQACLALRANGTLTLYYQGEHKVEYHKLTTNLTPNGSENSAYYTHASIGFTADKKVLVTAYDAISTKILTFSVSVDWGFLVASAAKQKTDPHYYTPIDKQTPPTLTAFLLHEMSPMPYASAEAMSQGRDFSVEQTRLSSIDILSPYYLPGSALDILISYECVSSENTVCSLIQRFRVKEAVQLLVGPFSSMGDPDNSSKGRFSTLELQDKINVANKINHIRTVISGSIVLLVGEDSTMIPINRANWSLISPFNEPDVKMEFSEGNSAQGPTPDTINSLLDCGFEIPRLHDTGAPFLFVVSPNLTGIVHLRLGSTEPPKFSVLKRTTSVPHIRLLGQAFSHTHAHACYSNTSSDDLMALIQVEYDLLDTPQQKEQLVQSIIAESHSAINFYLNSFNKESVDKLLSNPPLQKLLSLQLTMSDLGQKKVSGDIAWIILSLRSTSFGIMFSLSSIYRQMSKKKPVEDSMEDSINRAECIISLVGSVKWFIDLLIYLNQELLQLSAAKNNSESSLISINNSVVLPILMSKVPRLFLMYAISSIGKTHEILKKLHKDLSESNKLFTPMKEALERFFNTSNYSPLKLSNFESFLRESDGFITKELTSKWPDRTKSLQFEQNLFCNGVVPEELIPMAYSLVDRFTASNSRDPRLSMLYFYDTRWLQVGAPHDEIMASEEARNGHPEPTQVRLQYSETEAIDALRKVFIFCRSPIASGGTTPMGQYFNSTYKVKKCVRCRSVSLVSDPLVFESPKTIGLWTMVFQRNCICGSAWVNVSHER